MQADPTPENTEISLNNKTSVMILQERCRRWVQANFKSDPWMPSFALATNTPPAGTSPLHVVLMGDFVSQILKFQKWPQRPIYLWVLSSAVKNVMVQVLGFSEKSVGVIPRYDLFPVESQPLPFPPIDADWTMVFGGRIVPPKNLEFAIRTVSFLQNEFSQNVRLKCFGVFGNQARLNFQEGVSANYEESIRSLCDSLPFKMKPEFHPPKSGQDWLQGEHNVCISFSTYHMEDLGVSVAQAQEIGLPCIMTDWGGHKDVTGENVFKFPEHFLGLPQEKTWIQDGRAFALASEIVKFQKAKKVLSETPQTANLQPPEPVDLVTIVSRVKNLEKKYSEDVHGLFKDTDWDFILHNDLGRLFFKNYNEAFGSTTANVKHTVVLQPGPGPNVITVPSLELSWGASQSHSQKITFFPVPESEDFKCDPEIANCDTLVDLRPTIASCCYLNHLRNKVNLSARLIFNLHELASTAFFPAFFNVFSDLFRAGDVFLASCAADKKILEGLIKNPKVHVVQFPIHQLLMRPIFRDANLQLFYDADPSQICFYYCGPTREESNLHNILFALRLFQKRNPFRKFRFEIYPHDFGSGLRSIESFSPVPEYEKYLQELTKDMRLEKLVDWQRSLQIRKLIFLQKNTNRIFVSASLQTNEYLGYFTNTALSLGDRAVVSGWGPHLDLPSNFNDQVKVFPVRKSSAGPFMSPIDIALALEEIVSNDSPKKNLSSLPVFQNVISTYKEIVSSFSKETVEPTPFFLELIRLRTQRLLSAFSHNKSFKSTLLFESFQDPNIDFFLTAYGMKSPEKNTKEPRGFLLSPWVKVEKRVLSASDPMRGAHQLKRKQHIEPAERVTCLTFERTGIEQEILSRDEANWLVDLGLAFEVDVANLKIPS